MPATGTALVSITVVSAPVLAASDTDRQNESRAHQLTTAVIICPIFAAVFAALRVYTRLFLIKVRFWEDLTVVFAWVGMGGIFLGISLSFCVLVLGSSCLA